MKPAQLVVLLGGAGVPTAPTLSAPENAAVLDDTTPEFSWQAVPGAVTYDIEIRATLTGTPTATGISGTTYTPSALDLLTVYYARVRGVNANGAAGAWSATLTFAFKTLDADYANDDLWSNFVDYATLAAFLTGSGVTFARNSVAHYLNGVLYAQAAVNTLRDAEDRDYELGLLLEGARENEAPYSNSAGDGWGTTSVTRTTGQPDIFGGATAIKYTNTGAVGPIIAQEVGTFTGQPETLYAILEQVDATNSTLWMRNLTASSDVLAISLTWATGATGVILGSGTHGSILIDDAGPNGGKVYLVWMTFTGTAGNTRRVQIRPSGNTTSLFNTIIHHIQLEESPFYSSPIVTAATALTRVADSFVRTVTHETALSKTVYAKTSPLASGDQVLWQRDDGSEDNRLRIVYDTSGHLRYIVTTATVEQVNIDLGVVAVNTFFTVAIRAAENDFAASINAGAPTTDTTGTMPAGLVNERLGSDSIGNQWFGYIQREITF